jgi:hypothetical protein
MQGEWGEWKMLGRHVYRVSPLDSGQWSVRKDGEAAARASCPTREEASRCAWDLAMADEPSKVVIEERNGAIADERLFGADAALDLERAARGEQAPPPKGEPPSRR